MRLLREVRQALGWLHWGVLGIVMGIVILCIGGKPVTNVGWTLIRIVGAVLCANFGILMELCRRELAKPWPSESTFD